LETDAVKGFHSFSIEPTIYLGTFRSFRIGRIAPGADTLPKGSAGED
jgi:hypothetical protein